MVVVTKIKVVHTEGNTLTLSHCNLGPVTADGHMGDVTFTREEVKGMLFTNERGEDVYLGLTKEVEDTLGVHLKAQFLRMNALEKALSYHKGKMLRMQCASFWTRLKYLVTGEVTCLWS